MAQPISLIQNNFTSGELSERMLGRTDTNQYYNGAESIENFVILPQGGLKRRSGTAYAGEIKGTSPVRLIPFVFSTEQAYILEFGEKYIRVYKDGGLVLKPDGRPVEIATPFTAEQLSSLWYTQSSDVMTICHEKHPVKELRRMSHIDWKLINKKFVDGPFGDLNKTDIKLSVSAKSGEVDVTATSAVFKSGDVGRAIRILIGTRWGSLDITSFTSATKVRARYQKGLDFEKDDTLDKPNQEVTLAPSLYWKLGAFCAENGYPRCLCYFKERLWFAGTPKYVNRYWSSKTNDFEKFSTTDKVGEVLDDCAIDGQIADDGVNAITYITPLQFLAIGTTDGEFSLSQASNSYVFSNTNYKVDIESHYGGSTLKPIRAHSTSVFVQRDNKKLYQYNYEYSTDTYKGSDISLLSEHITRDTIKELTYAQQPNTLIYTVLKNGTIAACTFLPDQKVLAWHKIMLGGRDVKVKSIATIPNKLKGHDEVWVVVERSIGKTKKTYLEFFEDNFDITSTTELKDSFFVDSGLSLYSDHPVNAISGLNHLAGETVSILADGAVQEDREVSAEGKIELTHPASVVHIGLPYTSRVITLPIYVDQQQQTVIGNKKMIYKIGMYFHSTLGGKFGFKGSLNPLREIFTRKTSDKMDAAPPLFTGLKYHTFPNNYDNLPSVIIEQTQPLPMNINALSYTMAVSIA